MKRIGTTENGNLLIECTREEWDAFRILDRVARGYSWSGYQDRPDRIPMDQDFAAAFSAIQLWVNGKSQANSLRNIADLIDQEMKVKTPETEQPNDQK